MNWGGKFLKKMWCFVGGGCDKVIVFSSEWTIRSDEGLTLETSAEETLLWPIYIINSFDKTKLPFFSNVLHVLIEEKAYL